MVVSEEDYNAWLDEQKAFLAVEENKEGSNTEVEEEADESEVMEQTASL